MQDGKKFDINGNLLGPDGRELDAFEDVEALFEEPAFTEEVVEAELVTEPIAAIEPVIEPIEPVIEPVVEPKPEVVKPKPRAKAKAKPVVEQTELDDLA
jgi:outer membrane biosynthesis protein TonB